MRKILQIVSLAIIVTGNFCVVYGQRDRVVQRLYLVGDAGEFRDGRHPVCDWLKQHVDWNDTSNVLVYLGDNVYPRGVPAAASAGLEHAHKQWDYQPTAMARSKAK